ncbi:hypothetical protein LCGC14_1830530, partial [marine sediment metagenome]
PQWLVVWGATNRVPICKGPCTQSRPRRRLRASARVLGPDDERASVARRHIAIRQHEHSRAVIGPQRLDRLVLVRGVPGLGSLLRVEAHHHGDVAGIALPDIDLDAPVDKLDTMDDKYIHYGGNIHGLDYPLRGVVIDGNVYIVDSYDADHTDLNRVLRDQGLESIRGIPITIEKQTTTPRSDLEDYAIGALYSRVSTLKKIPTVTRMKMPIGKWN